MIAANSTTITLPSPIDDEYLSEEIGKLGAQPRDTISWVEHYNQVIKLYRLLRQVLDIADTSIHKSEDFMSLVRTISRLHGLVLEWRDRLPAHLRFNEQITGHNAANPGASDKTSGSSSEPLEFADVSKRLFCK